MDSVRCSIVTYNNAETISDCLHSLRDSKGGFELKTTVIDNDSRDSTVEVVKDSFPEVTVIEAGENLGFGKAHNRVILTCKETYSLVLNPDATLHPDALALMLEALRDYQEAGIVGPKVEYKSNWPQLSFGSFPGFFADLRQGNITRAIQRRNTADIQRLETILSEPFSPDWVSGSCFVARTETLSAVNGFDERFFLYMEDVDLCRRLHALGKMTMVLPQAICRHIEGHSQSDKPLMKQHYRRSRLLYENKHGSRFGFFIYKLLRARKETLAFDKALVWRAENRLS